MYIGTHENHSIMLKNKLYLVSFHEKYLDQPMNIPADLCILSIVKALIWFMFLIL